MDRTDSPVGDEARLRDWLVTRGVASDVIDDAIASGTADSLVSDLVLLGDAHLSARDLADRARMELAVVLAVFHDLGVVVADPDEAMFTESDAALIIALHDAHDAGLFEGTSLLRVVAGSMERMAEAAVAVYVQGQEEQLRRRRAPLMECVEANWRATKLGLDIGAGLAPVFRHHVLQAVERQRIIQNGVSRREMARLAVGFVDLVESTALQAELDPVALGEQVSRFEARAFEVTSSGGGRLVKFIGDEIMVAVADPVAACRIVVDLIDAFTDDGTQPRAGLVFGEVLFRHGDYYGPVVNLAARLVDAAIPGEALVGASVVEAVKEEDLAFEPAGRRMVKGFAAPVAVWTLTADDA
jgi:class 3 adenylate cyclase